MREFALLNHIYAANDAIGGHVVVPPGDDMAVVEVRGVGGLGGRQVLLGVDQVVDGRHVRLATTPLELVGRKVITRSLSDVAAMAAQPVAVLVAATLPPDFGEARANALFDAMRATTESYQCSLVGGDIAVHADAGHPLVCSTTVLAQPGSTAPITRSGAKAGDTVYVTGELGGSLDADGNGHHLTFVPRIAEALALASRLGERLHAMIDLSDGLGRDASHIAELSDVHIAIEADRLPCRAGVDWRGAMSDGEDYELCFCASGQVPDAINDVPVTAVGEVEARAPATAAHVTVCAGGETLGADELGWEHGR